MSRIDPRDVVHPEDRAAIDNLQSMALFPAAAKAFMKAVPEDMLAGLYMVQKIRLGPNQLPRLHALLPPICGRLGIVEPEFYLEMDPRPNAYTYGDTRTFITVTSGLLQSMDEDELRTVVAHECGHVFARHVLYRTMVDLLLEGGARFLGIPGILTAPIQASLFYWYRRSELTADRVAALVCGGAKEVVEMLIRLSGGPLDITKEVNTEAFLAQADAFRGHTTGKWSDFLQNVAIMSAQHPWSALRAAEVTRWCETTEFARLRKALEAADARTCPCCGNDFESDWKYCRRCGKQIGANTGGRK